MKLDCTTCSVKIDTSTSSYYDLKPRIPANGEKTTIRDVSLYFCSDTCLAQTKYEIDKFKKQIVGS